MIVMKEENVEFFFYFITHTMTEKLFTGIGDDYSVFQVLFLQYYGYPSRSYIIGSEYIQADKSSIISEEDIKFIPCLCKYFRTFPPLD